jgi:hypothetical protein
LQSGFDLRNKKMKKYCLLLIAAMLLTLPNILRAASLVNRDGKPRKIKGRSEGSGWMRTTIYPGGNRYFDCRYGCEIKVLDTGSTIYLESDADVVISNGILRRR